ncbi:ABC transporter ATP-binding protein [Agrobacterium sp. CNPSo 2736]|uniref:ABC transporter ATP-binding protein n=1 Tax=Agrobacterium sp. CNPSo 2736 TaxID=2499627 RepID=UPI0032AF389F
MLQIDALSVALPPNGDRTFAVRDVTLTVGRGECVCLVGESGSGKSVTGQAILGMLPEGLRQAGGSIAFTGAPLPTDPKALAHLRGRRIGLISQEPLASLDPVMTVGRQLDEVLAVHGATNRSSRRARILELFAAVRLPDPERIYRSYPHQLSGGQCQRIVIAMALAHNPALLIADEPTTALDVTTQAEILRLIATLRADFGAGLLFITHDLAVVADIADRVLVMQEGEVVESGTRDALFSDPRHPYTRKLLAALPKRHERPLPPIDASPTLAADKLAVHYKVPTSLFRYRDFPAVTDASLVLRRGETHGVVGESGSGKSTLVRALLNLEPIAAGRIMVAGQEILPGSPPVPRALRRKMQIVLQDPYTALDPRQSIGDAVSEGAIIHGASARQARARTMELMAQVGLPARSYDRFPHEFSGGQRQRICIIRALAVEPEILIADEAVSALDVSIQAQILELFASLQAQMGFALLFVTHDLRVAGAICDHISVMENGRIVEQGTTAQVLDAPRADYTRKLVAAIPDRGNAARSSLAGGRP